MTREMPEVVRSRAYANYTARLVSKPKPLPIRVLLDHAANSEAMLNHVMPDDFVEFLRLANGARIKDAWLRRTTEVGWELRDPGWTGVVIFGIALGLAASAYHWLGGNRRMRNAAQS